MRASGAAAGAAKTRRVARRMGSLRLRNNLCKRSAPPGLNRPTRVNSRFRRTERPGRSRIDAGLDADAVDALCARLVMIVSLVAGTRRDEFASSCDQHL